MSRVRRLSFDHMPAAAIIAILVCSLTLAIPHAEAAASPLGDQLRRGGVILVIRHAATDQSKQERGSRRPQELPDPTQSLARRPAGREENRRRRAATADPASDGAVQSVLPHPRDGENRVRPLEGQLGPFEHRHGRPRRGMATSNPRGSALAGDEARQRPDHRAGHARQRRRRCDRKVARRGRDARLPPGRRRPVQAHRPCPST